MLLFCVLLLFQPVAAQTPDDALSKFEQSLNFELGGAWGNEARLGSFIRYSIPKYESECYKQFEEEVARKECLKAWRKRVRRQVCGLPS